MLLNQWTNAFFTVFRLCHEDHEIDHTINYATKVILKLHTDNQKTSKGFKLEYKSSGK